MFLSPTLPACSSGAGTRRYTLVLVPCNRLPSQPSSHICRDPELGAPLGLEDEPGAGQPARLGVEADPRW